MNWPDPKCRGPHDPGFRYLKWQHTDECKSLKPKKIRDVIPEDAEMAAMTPVERARVLGGL